MALQRQLCHASSARYSQNPRRHIPCRPSANRSLTRASFEAGYPVGHRPSVDRNYRPNIGCCRLRGRPRAIPPGFRVGSCRPCGLAFYDNGIDACANENEAEPSAQIINPLGGGTAPSYSASWAGCDYRAFSSNFLGDGRNGRLRNQPRGGAISGRALN